MPPEVKGITLAQTQFRKLEGYYEINSSPVELRFIGEEGRMAFLGSYLLFPLGQDLFYSPQDYTKVKVIFGEDGSVKALKWGRRTMPPAFPIWVRW